MYKIFHNHETGVITIGETRPEDARIQCLDLVTAQNTVRALNAVAVIAARGLLEFPDVLGLDQ